MNLADYSERIRAWLLISNRWLDSWVGRLYSASAAAVVYVYAYQHHGARPGANATYPLGWLGWWDQGRYLKCAVGLAHGNLTQDTYWYPLGYPVFGALFYRLMPQDPFFPPGLLLAVGIALLFYEIARKFVSPVEAVLLLALFVFSYRGTLSISIVEPWNTLPTHFLAYAVILLAGLREPSRRNIFIATICVGLIYFCRPPDVLCAGLVVGVAILHLPTWGERIRRSLFALVTLSVFVAATLLINRAVFASWRTPYEMTSASIGFGSYPYAQKFFALMIDAKPIFNLDDTAMLLHYPWLILLPPGLVYFVRKYRGRAIGVLSSIAAAYGLYFSYNDFWPGNIFLYHLIHYLVWTLPILFLITYVGFKEAWKDRLGRWSFSLILPVVLLVCFLTLRRERSGQILTASLSDSKVVTVGPNIAWMLFRESSGPPKLRSGEVDFTPYLDFVAPGRGTGSLILLSTAAQKRAVTIDLSETPDLRTIHYGTLKWSLQWPPRSVIATARYLAPPRVTLLGKLEGVDVAGPAGTPDGQPDMVIQIEGSRNLLERISDWDIATTDGRGRWLTARNPNGWWLIKVVLSTEPASDPSRMRLRLCFPDHGDFERAPAFVLRAVDIDGNLLINQKFQK